MQRARLEFVQLVDPTSHSEARWYVLDSCRAQPFDRNHPLNPSGTDAGVLQDNRATERVADERQWISVEVRREGFEVGCELRRAVLAADGPIAVTMPAQVDRIDAEPIDQAVGNAVPVSRVISSAVDENDRRQALIAPNDVMEAKTLRRVVARLWLRQGVYSSGFLGANSDYHRAEFVYDRSPTL